VGLLLPVFAVDHAFDSVAKMEYVKIDQKTDSDSAEAQVGEELGLMDGVGGVAEDGFHLMFP
jgi:hypothetical protein